MIRLEDIVRVFREQHKRQTLSHEDPFMRELEQQGILRRPHMIRNITIRPVLNGFVCQVGCQEVVFDSKEKLTIALVMYLDHPERFEREFTATACNRNEVVGGPGNPVGLGNIRTAAHERAYQQAQDVCKTATEGCGPIQGGYAPNR